MSLGTFLFTAPITSLSDGKEFLSDLDVTLTTSASHKFFNLFISVSYCFEIRKLLILSKINFTDLFLNYSEYFQRLNIHQSDIESSDSLTRINEEIASPYHLSLIHI